MKTASPFTNRFAAAASALVLSLVLIGGTVAEPARASVPACSAFVSAVA